MNSLFSCDIKELAIINTIWALQHQSLTDSRQTYDTKNIPALVATMRQLFELYRHCEIIISATVRNANTLETFLDACSKLPPTRVDQSPNLREGDSKFDCRLIEFDAPGKEDQIGFFHSTTVPIRLYSIKSTMDCPDPFAPA